MKQVHQYNDVILLSSKSVERARGHEVRFCDGSTANLRSRSCVNRGPGQIRFVYWPEYEVQSGPTPRAFEFSGRERLVLNGGDLYFDVRPSPDDVTRVVLTGSAEFQRDTIVRDLGDAIVIQTTGSGNHTTMIVNGRRVGDPVDGRIEIQVPRCGALTLECRGAGIGRVHVPVETLDAQVTGSMALHCETVDDANVQVRGSGDVHVEHLAKSCQVDIAGSGNVQVASGEFPVIDARVSGSGTILAAVTVREASLEQIGSGSIVVAHVTDHSSETHGGSGSITVLRRGAELASESHGP